MVHEDLIKEHSPFCNSALSKDWVSGVLEQLQDLTPNIIVQLENQEKLIRLPEHEPDVFRMYLECIYTPGVVDFAALSGFQIVEEVVRNDDKGRAAMHSMFMLWIAADYLGDVSVANAIMDGVMLGIYQRLTIRWSSFVYIYDNTAAGSPLRRWSVDWLSAALKIENLANPEFEVVPRGLVLLLLGKLLRDRLEGKKICRPSIADKLSYYL